MGDLARWRNFTAGVTSAMVAGGGVACFDALRVARAPTGGGDVVASSLAAAAMWLGAGAVLGLWFGGMLAGLLARRSPYDVLDGLIAPFRRGDRDDETRKVAALLAWILVVALWLGGAALFVKVLVARMVNANLEAAAVTLVLTAWALLLRGSFPSTRDAIASVLDLRTRLIRAQTGVCTFPVVLACLLASVVGAVIVTHQRIFNMLYALNLEPFAYAGALVLSTALVFLALGTDAGDLLLERMPRWLPAPLLAGGLAACGTAVTAAIDDVALREALFEGSPLTEVMVVAIAGPLDGDAEIVPAEEDAAEAEAEDQAAHQAAAVDGPAGARPNDVLIISMDTVRADHLGMYGYATRPTSPNLDAFVARGTRFEHAYASGPCSSASFMGIVTSQLASRIPGVVRDGDIFKLPARVPTIAGRFRDAGYHTRALMPVIGDYLKGIDSGFDRFDGTFHYAETLADNAVKVLSAPPAERPQMLWVHFIDAHHPYDKHRGFTSFGSSPQALYDQEIAYMDKQVARVLEALEESGRADRTVVAVLADHGEAFGEHGTRLHGNSLHDEEIRVPLAFVGPGVKAQALREPASLLDVGPTLVELAGVDWRGSRPLGGSLAALIRGEKIAEPRTVIAEGCKPGTMMALIGEQKLFYRKRSGLFFLYDLQQDPLERANLFSSSPHATQLATVVRQEIARGRN